MNAAKVCAECHHAKWRHDYDTEPHNGKCRFFNSAYDCACPRFAPPSEEMLDILHGGLHVLCDR